ncbi:MULTISPECIES: 1-phosphofructokinase [unclassified Leptolyngbya]|uniref:1-phosphofructokinase n=1 Tax=unclassified Leptolyngbya TaxID=2650499 RepID=UPI0016886F2C|nr:MULTISPECIES: 1-phosphofructokinase [unclassified Leptolyngbya]MBD1909788.1 1-phosphofructokinase [Leptolyngbya sp. FACHB-8]MBD2158939.1 1-phosphofructokinase [Leptolyngbya sp. FACHB-16]
MTTPSPGIVTVTLNPAVDQTAAIPNFTPNAVNRVAWEQTDAGGKGVNVASFLADYGYAVSVTGLLGRENPERFEALFQQKAIANHFVRIAGNTRVNVKIVDEAQQQVTDINFPGQSPVEDDLKQLDQVFEQLAARHEWFILSGSIPAGVPPSIYQEMTTRLKQAGKHVVLDTSGPPLQQAIAAAPDFIKPNQLELQEVLGQSLDTEARLVEAARSLVQQGIRWVVVSLGADGALFVDADNAIHAQPPSVDVKSTVGAGDAMVAGTVAAHIQGKPLDACARLGTAFAMGALTQIGPRLPPMATIAEYGDRVTLRHLD